MDRLAGKLHLHGGAMSMEWADGCEPIRDEKSGAEVVVLGPAAVRRDPIARELAGRPERPAEFLGPLHRTASGFAFALWAPSEKRLSLGCDPLGLQSLYYRTSEGGVTFGGRLSDVSSPGQKEKIHLATAEHFLRFLSVPPGRTLVGEVRRVLPGEWIFFPAGEGNGGALFPLQAESPAGQEEAAVELRETLKASVRAAIGGAAAEDPPGVLLSGGIDSTALLAILREVWEGPIVAVHASQEGNPDRYYARLMAERYDAELLDIPLTARDGEDSLAWIVAGMEAPSGNASAVANCRAFAKAHERGVKRILSGLGSDEIFCGQGKHLMTPLWPWLSRLPTPLRTLASSWAPGAKKDALRRVFSADGGPAEMHREMYAFFEKEESEHLRGGLARFAQAIPAPWREGEEAGFPPGYSSEILQVDLNLWLRSSLTPMAGVLAAASGIELYLPFCGPKMLDLSAALPLSWKVKGREGKRVLRRAVEELIPDEIFRRPGQGFTVPMKSWLTNGLSSLARDLLSPERVERWSILDPQAMMRMLADHQAGKGDWSLPIWAWMTFSIWYEQFIDGDGGG
ncbi:asparagine synthetase B family protein [Nitrospinota bacterium]